MTKCLQTKDKGLGAYLSGDILLQSETKLDPVEKTKLDPEEEGWDN